MEIKEHLFELGRHLDELLDDHVTSPDEMVIIGETTEKIGEIKKVFEKGFRYQSGTSGSSQ